MLELQSHWFKSYNSEKRLSISLHLGNHQAIKFEVTLEVCHVERTVDTCLCCEVFLLATFRGHPDHAVHGEGISFQRRPCEVHGRLSGGEPEPRYVVKKSPHRRHHQSQGEGNVVSHFITKDTF